MIIHRLVYQYSTTKQLFIFTRAEFIYVNRNRKELINCHKCFAGSSLERNGCYIIVRTGRKGHSLAHTLAREEHSWDTLLKRYGHFSYKNGTPW